MDIITARAAAFARADLYQPEASQELARPAMQIGNFEHIFFFEHTDCGAVDLSLLLGLAEPVWITALGGVGKLETELPGLVKRQ